MTFFVDAASFVLSLFLMLLLARIVISFVMAFARDWKPTGFALVAVESVLTVTDPPIKLVRRLVPPLAIGNVRLDLAIMIVMIATMLVQGSLGLLL